MILRWWGKFIVAAFLVYLLTATAFLIYMLTESVPPHVPTPAHAPESPEGSATLSDLVEAFQIDLGKLNSENREVKNELEQFRGRLERLEKQQKRAGAH